MSVVELAALLGATGMGAIIAAIVNGVFAKRRLGAEATEIITKAAAGVVTNMQAEIDRQVRRNGEQQARHERDIARLLQDREEEVAEYRNQLRLHATWDAMVVKTMELHGVDLPEPPPLLPE